MTLFDDVVEALGVSIATADESLVRQNENLLLGNELSELNEDSPYARVSLCLVDEKKIGQGENLFNAIKTINYTRYHCNPEGFMMRISSANKRESVRISKESILKGLSFEKAGNLLIREFLKNPHVLKVKNIFINLKEFEYKKLEALINRTELIVKTIDHIAETSIMDCASCGLKKVCDEVEEIKELHFKKQFQS